MFIRIKSHRARENFFGLIGRKPQGFYALRPKQERGIYEVTDAEWAKFAAARSERRTYWHSSITRARVNVDSLMRCW